VHLNSSPGARFRTGVKPFKRVILLVLAVVLVLEIPRKIEDEDEKDDEDEPKTGIFHTSSSKRRPLQQFAFGGNFQDAHGKLTRLVIHGVSVRVIGIRLGLHSSKSHDKHGNTNRENQKAQC